MSEVAAIPASETSAENIEAVKPEATSAQVVAAKQKYKLQIDGVETEEEFDPNDHEAVRKELQLSRAAKKRMSEAVAEKRKAFEIIKAFEADPESMLKRLGPKGREIAEKYLLAQINDDMLTPAEKELRALKSENETYKQKEAREKAELEKSTQAKKENEYAQSFQSTIIAALNKSGLPKTPELVKRMASVMSKNLEFGLELTPDDLVAEVKSDITALFKSIIGDSDGEQIAGLFGDDVANKLRKHDLKKLQERQSQVFQSGKKPDVSPAQKAEGRPYQTPDEWRAENERRIK